MGKAGKGTSEKVDLNELLADVGSPSYQMEFDRLPIEDMRRYLENGGKYRQLYKAFKAKGLITMHEETFRLYLKLNGLVRTPMSQLKKRVKSGSASKEKAEAESSPKPKKKVGAGTKSAKGKKRTGFSHKAKPDMKDIYDD